MVGYILIAKFSSILVSDDTFPPPITYKLLNIISQQFVVKVLRVN